MADLEIVMDETIVELAVVSGETQQSVNASIAAHNASAAAHGLTAGIYAGLQGAYLPTALNPFITKNGMAINVREYGALGDGSTDDTTAFVNAIAALPSGGGAIYIPHGTYIISSSLVVTKTIKFYGDGHASILRTKSTATTLVMFDLTTTAASYSTFRDLTIDSAATMTEGAAIRIGQTSQVSEIVVDNVNFIDQYRAINFVQAVLWKIDKCIFVTNGGQTSPAIITIQNTGNPDGGDNCISNCTFQGSGTNTYLILHLSGGGLKMIASKFIGGSFGYSVQYNGNVGSGAVQVSGCSFEGASSAEVYLSDAGGNGFQSLAFSGCEFGGSASDLFSCNSATVTGVAINGCNFVGTNNGVVIRAGGGMNVSGNTFYNLGLGIFIQDTPNVSNVVLGYNTYVSVGTKLLDTGNKATGAAQ